MKALMCWLAALSVVAPPAISGSRYDLTLEQAVLGIVAAKMGDIRGGFSYDAKPQIVVNRDAMFTGAIGIETARLARQPMDPEAMPSADERKVSRIIVY